MRRTLRNRKLLRLNWLWFLSVLCVYPVFLLHSGCARYEIKNARDGLSSIVCFGDSITYGYGAEAGEDYPSILAELSGVTVVNSGVSGDTTTRALGRVEDAVLTYKPELVIVQFGANDFLEQVPKNVTVENMRVIIRRAQAKGAMVAIADISAGMLFREYRGAFQQLAHQEGAFFIPDAVSGIITNPSLKSDFVHPNAQGYRLIAQRVYRAIRYYLK
jgi:acyl-CoA thioesterase I